MKAEFFKSVPRDKVANLKFRVRVLEAARDNKALQGQLKEICKQDILFFIGVFVWQMNPLRASEGVRAADPFIPWELQKRALLKEPGVFWPREEEDELGDAGLIWCITNQRSLVIEKSREMGASWLCLLVYLWYFLFHPYQKFHCISRNEEMVESENSDSLFWKLDYVLEHLPVWLKPRGGVRRRVKFFGNDELRSQITGEACTKDAGISGRCRSMLMDEYAKMTNQAAKIRVGTASTTNCRIFNSTHEGMDTEFFALCQSPEFHKLRMHWTQHPDKIKGLYLSGQPVQILDKNYDFGLKFNFVMDGNPVGGPRPQVRSPWYDAKCHEIGSTRGVSQDLDINPSGAVSQFFEPLVIHGLIREFARSPDWEGDLIYDRQTGKNAKLVRDSGGRIKLWIHPDASGKIPPGRFGAGCDVSMGTGASNSCLCLGDAETGEKFLEYQNPNLYPNDFSVFCFALLNLFSPPPLLAFEAQGPGNVFRSAIVKLGYRNFWYNERSPILPNPRLTGEPGWSPGWTNNGKKHLLENYQNALRKRTFLNPSEVGLKDCLAWKYDKNGGIVHAGFKVSNDPSGARDNHGDQTIADALCFMCLERLGVSEQKKTAAEIPMGSLNWRRRLHAAPLGKSWAL